jgi:predicted dehydrogenase
MAKQIKVGVVGCGYWGPNLVRNFRSLPDCHLKMMCDISEARLKHLRGLYPEVEGEMDYNHMLNGSGLEAVVIATSVKSHYPMAKASLLAGKHTFIEKPMAASTRECEELIEIAQRNGLVLMVGHTFLYSPAVRKIKEIVIPVTLGRSAIFAHNGSTWGCSKRTSTWRGIWRRTTFPSSCTSCRSSRSA